MTKPDSSSPDHGASQDDAVWLDLVSRLEAGSPGVGPDDGSEAPAGPAPIPDAAGIARFRQFDPLGLAAAPKELSAVERDTAAKRPEAVIPPSDLRGPRDYGVDDDTGFVPEEPPSLAGTAPLTMLAWLGAVGGPIALLLSVMFWRSAPLMAFLGIVAAFVVSVVYLIMKLPQEKDENDDGARV